MWWVPWVEAMGKRGGGLYLPEPDSALIRTDFSQETGRPVGRGRWVGKSWQCFLSTAYFPSIKSFALNPNRYNSPPVALRRIPVTRSSPLGVTTNSSQVWGVPRSFKSPGWG